MTYPEVLLWIELKGKKLHGRKFRRQHSIGKYIVDFYCASEKLIIEVEGSVHYNLGQNLYDGDRLEFLEKEGFKILVFENQEIEKYREAVLNEITRNFKH